MCDGSQLLRLAITRTPAHLGGAGGQWITFPYALGMNSVYVRGDCQYWIQEGVGGRTQLLRTGTLTEELAAELARDMHYSQLDQFDDHYGTELDLGGYFVVSDGQKAVWCRGYCTETPTAPQQLQEMEARYQAWNTRLLAMSSDVTGPMWALFTKSLDVGPADTDCDLSWPFSFEPGPLAQAHTASTDDLQPILIDVPEAQELRSWWRNNLESPNPCYPDNSGGSFYVQEEDQSWTLYSLLMRDSMPLENAEGLLPLPHPESGL